MATKSYIQNSFHAGEWAPQLNARVDLEKYNNAAALLENFFVDYRGGASSRFGTRYVLQAYDSVHDVRLIEFQASFQTGFVCEFGHQYVRFFTDGAPVLELPVVISNITQANPGVVTAASHGYTTGDVIFISGVGGMTQVNGDYYLISVLNINSYQLFDLRGNPIDTSAFSAYTSGGASQRVYKINSPYTGTELALLKVAQQVDQMVICHPNHSPYILEFINDTNWTLTQAAFGTNINPPVPVSITTSLGPGTVNYAYLMTTVNANDEESVPSAALTLTNAQDIRATAGSIQVNFTAVSGAAFYNIYKAEVSYGNPVPGGAAFGYIGNCTSTSFVDSNISPDFSQTPPIAQNPFFGSGIASYTVTVTGTYTTVPAVTVDPPASGATATANAVLQVQGTPTIGSAGAGYAANDTITLANGVTVVVNTITAGAINDFKAITVSPSVPGAITSGTTPANPTPQVTSSGGGTGATVNLVWGVGEVLPVSSGSGYVGVPAVHFSSGAAAATAVLGSASDLNPSVPGFFQQRLVLGGLTGAPQTFYMSQTGAYFNFDITNPIQADNAISGSLVAGQLNSIKSMVAVPTGLILFTDKAAWLINGGGGATDASAVTPSNISANPHSYNGASDVPPIVANFDILYVQAKGSIVRDLTYNIYANIYTGTDISVLSSHLFQNHEVLQWAWAEEPYKIVWAIRDDGVLLSLTFLKEQQLIGWCHSITEGNFKSVCVNIEATAFGNVDAPYFIVERTINGQTYKYIERMAERSYTSLDDVWCVDSGLRYSGVPATSFSGGRHLAGLTCTGTADGAVIPPFVMPNDGTFTLAIPASIVTVGVAFTPKLQTVPINIPDRTGGTVQGKEKTIPVVTTRVFDSLGASIGKTFDSLTPMKDLVIGQVGSMSNQRVTGLTTADAQTILDPAWQTTGVYCIQQNNPWPLTVLGVIPEVTVGDTSR